MTKNANVVIRKATVTDIPLLQNFFIKAYGQHTVFRDKDFLLYYFSSRSKKQNPLERNLIGVNEDGEIVSHYGGLDYKFSIAGQVITMIWGVNAYTLPEWRGTGINSEMVEYLHNENEANAVIGMPYEAPFFYQKFGYNIFNKATMIRYIYPVEDILFDVVKLINQNMTRAKEVFGNKREIITDKQFGNIIELTAANFEAFDFDFESVQVASTYRDKDFLNWRIFNNPYIKYKVYGFLSGYRILTYTVVREEILIPTQYTVSRIIDLYGHNDGVLPLLKRVLTEAKINGNIYVDFSMFGKLYIDELQHLGFSRLENEDVCLLPQVSAPVENRPNHEFIVMQSKSFHEAMQSLSIEKVYLTRIDGDRDRINIIPQRT